MNGPTWKWIVGILIGLAGFSGSWYINSVQGQFADVRNESKINNTVVHQRITKLDEEKVDKVVMTECIKRLDEKIDNIHQDVKTIIRNQRNGR